MESAIDLISAFINAAMYLQRLAEQWLVTGVVFEGAPVWRVHEAARLRHSRLTADLIINRTGCRLLSLERRSTNHSFRKRTDGLRCETRQMECSRYEVPDMGRTK